MPIKAGLGDFTVLIYPQIDLAYYGNGRQMEYDFVVAPGADYSQIRLSYSGAKSVSVDALGKLIVETDWGTVAENPPIVYQMDNGEKRLVNGSYYAVSEGTLMGYNAETGRSGHSPVDTVAIPVFRAVLGLINLAKNFSPIDSLSTGRSVTWSELGQAFGQIVLLRRLLGLWEPAAE